MAVIAKEPIRNQVADLLREDILMGKYRPGDHIITAGLAEEFQIGRGVIREALMQLEAEGLVENRPYRGAFVAEVCSEELKEICDLRVMIEVHAVRELAGTLTDTDRFALQSLCAHMQESYEHRQYMEIVRSDSAFHGYLVKKVSSYVLFEAWNLTTPRLSAMFFSMLSKGYPVEAIAENHRKLIEVLFRDPEEYVRMLKVHYRKVIDFTENNPEGPVPGGLK